MSSERRVSWDAGFWIAGGLALVGSCVALARGVLSPRMAPTVAFAALWFVAASYVPLASRAIQRRVERLRTATIPRDVRLVRPLWIPLRDSAQVLAVGGGLGTGAALVGFPSVGAGIVLALAAVGFSMLIVVLMPTALTFETSGLRIYVRGGVCFLPWASVLDVTLEGPARAPSVNVRVADVRGLYESLTPKTRRPTFQLRILLGVGKPSGEALNFMDWSAGLDAPTLARALRESIAESRTHAN